MASNTMGPAAKDSIRPVLEDLKPQADQAQERLNQMIKDSGFDEKKIASLQNALQENPGNLGILLVDPELSKLDGMTEAVFGKGVNLDDAIQRDKLIEDIAYASGLTKEQLKSWSKKGAGGLLALILAMAAAPVIIGTGVALSATGVMGAGGRRAA